LSYIELTTDEDNLPSQKVVLVNGGRLVERFVEPAAYGGDDPSGIASTSARTR
jgi:predicted acetyltransferase